MAVRPLIDAPRTAVGAPRKLVLQVPGLLLVQGAAGDVQTCLHETHPELTVRADPDSAVARRELVQSFHERHLPVFALSLTLPTHDWMSAMSSAGVPLHHLHVAPGPCAAEFVRASCDGRELGGSFDIVGDVHGCCDELVALLRRMEYAVESVDGDWDVEPPAGRTVVLLGDLVDRGPDTVGALSLARALLGSGAGLAVAGNHDMRLLETLDGAEPPQGWGQETSLRQLGAAGDAVTDHAAQLLQALPSHYVLDEGRLVVAHAGLRRSMFGRDSGRGAQLDPVWLRALHGEFLPRRGVDDPLVRDFAWVEEDDRGDVLVAYGHTPVGRVSVRSGTVNLDTGCVYGGRLSALRYPEMEIVSVPSRSRPEQ